MTVPNRELTAVFHDIKARIDNGPWKTGKLEIIHVLESIEEDADVPDESWTAFDSNGHYHALDHSQVRERLPKLYPTLIKKSEQRPCPDHDPLFCDGWIDTWYECSICQEKVTPKVRSGPHRVTVPVHEEYILTYHGRMPTNGLVTVCVESGGWQWFGVATVTEITSSTDENDCLATLHSYGRWGRRAVPKS